MIYTFPGLNKYINKIIDDCITHIKKTVNASWSALRSLWLKKIYNLKKPLLWNFVLKYSQAFLSLHAFHMFSLFPACHVSPVIATTLREYWLHPKHISFFVTLTLNRQNAFPLIERTPNETKRTERVARYVFLYVCRLALALWYNSNVIVCFIVMYLRKYDGN